MAPFNIKRYYNDLAKLFQSGPTVRHRIANKIAAPGQVGVPVGTAKAFLRHVNMSYASTIASYGQYNRLARYSDYCEMESMAEISSGLDIYAEETCAKDEYGNILKIDSPRIEIRKDLETLFYDVLNIEFNAFNWLRNLCKYGDQFLLLDHHPDYGVLNLLPMPVNEVEREEGFEKENPLSYRYRWVTQGNRVLENWQVVHFRLLGNDMFLPYGSSILEPARRVWRQLILMEDAVMVYRIVRSPERRVFYIDVGNVAPQDIPAYMEKIKTQLKRNQVVDSNSGRVDLRYNPMSTDEDYFVPVRGEFSSRIETLPGGQFTGDIEDLNYIQSKLFAALKIPKSYLGYEQDIGSKSTLAQEDVRFARTIQRIQRVFVSELNKIAIIHLYSKGIEGEDLVNFEISMANPSTISDLQRLELWRAKFEVASLTQEGMFDRNFIYKRLWKLTDEEVEEIEEGKRKDRMFDAEIESIQAGAAASPEAAGGAPPQAVPSPEGGLPPPPGEEGGVTAPGEEAPIMASAEHAGKMLMDHQDPNAQVAAPNELIKYKISKKKEKLFPNLKNYAFNTKKTAMDPKRTYSELGRFAKAPFGEDVEVENDLDDDELQAREDRIFAKNIITLKKMVRNLDSVDELKSARNKKTKKVLSD